MIRSLPCLILKTLLISFASLSRLSACLISLWSIVTYEHGLPVSSIWWRWSHNHCPCTSVCSCTHTVSTLFLLLEYESQVVVILSFQNELGYCLIQCTILLNSHANYHLAFVLLGAQTKTITRCLVRGAILEPIPSYYYPFLIVLLSSFFMK